MKYINKGIVVKSLKACYAVSLLALTILLAACNKDDIDADAKVEFSSNEVTFDTVFTTMGSITKNFRVYNPYNFDIKVDVDLAGGQHSPYSINVDGVAGHSFKDVEIAAHDSIFVHVKVNIDPTDASLPFLVTDSVLFRHGRTMQDVDLVAFGQNANFIVADAGSGSLRYKIVAHEHEVVHWTNEKPYVVYGGYAAVDSLGTLIIDPGTKIYFHTGAGIWVYRYGNIQAVGTADEPIVFRGDKLSSWFNTDYAQWDRIWINEGNTDNRFEHVEISNAYIGLQVETLSEYLQGRTIVKNSTIHNTYSCGILGRAARLTAENCQVSNNGEHGLALSVGEYDLRHLTVANYFTSTSATRKTPTVYVSDSYSDDVYNYIGNCTANFTNCIIYGLLENEVSEHSSHSEDVSLTTHFDHCLIRSAATFESFHDCILNNDPLFVSKSEQDYHLKDGSPAINAGKTGLGIAFDIEGKARDGQPDIGAFEFE